MPRSPLALVSSSSSHNRNCLSLVGMGISVLKLMISVTPLNAHLGVWGRKIQVEHNIMKCKDSRTKVVNEPPKICLPNVPLV